MTGYERFKDAAHVSEVKGKPTGVASSIICQSRVLNVIFRSLLGCIA